MNEWGTGQVFITTNNAGMLPHSLTGSPNTVIVNPLSEEESAELIGNLAGYKLSEEEKQQQTTTANEKNWRYIPPVMVRYVVLFVLGL